MSFPPLHPLPKRSGGDKRGADETRPRCPRAEPWPHIAPSPQVPLLPVGPGDKHKQLNREQRETSCRSRAVSLSPLPGDGAERILKPAGYQVSPGDLPLCLQAGARTERTASTQAGSLQNQPAAPAKNDIDLELII